MLGDGQGEELVLFSTQSEQLMPAWAGATTAQWSAPVGTGEVLRLHAELEQKKQAHPPILASMQQESVCVSPPTLTHPLLAPPPAR